MAETLRVRKDVTKLSQEELTTLVRAFKGIQEKDTASDDSFFTIAGYHGMPFRGAGWGNSQWWGGYCHHGNVLFPTWHRAYMDRLEQALRTVPGCENVAMAYWNEPASIGKTAVVPEIFTSPTFPLDGVDIPNPLYSYKFQKKIVDNIGTTDAQNPYDYGKPKDYSTVRYPQSGLMGENDAAKTEAHNKLYGDAVKNAQMLNENVSKWLTQPNFINSDGATKNAGVGQKFTDCMKAPNYTVFSNTTSAAEWNNNIGPSDASVVPIESPHNDMHLAVGGFQIPEFFNTPGQPFNANFIPDAQGDMGENDTAAFDPIFYFHHCWIDNVFWQWQLAHDAKDGTKNSLSIIDAYPGTNSVDSQGPTPGIPGGSWLSLDTPLQPFVNKATNTYYTSHELVNIETQLGYTYDGPAPRGELLLDTKPAPVVAHITNINKRDMRGSFNIGVVATVAGKEQLLGQESVLSRWHMEGCGNCQLHTGVQRFIPLHGVTHEHVNSDDFEARVHVFTRDEGVKAGVSLRPKVEIIKKHV